MRYLKKIASNKYFNMSKFISIAIPTYEMSGMGKSFLEHSFRMLESQLYKDFDVVISDHSFNNDIEELCKNWSKVLDIKYLKNEDNRGNSSENLNNALRNCSGKWIKILFQDDYLSGPSSLNTLHNNIKETDKRWVITSCDHSDDGIHCYRPFHPMWNDNIHMGNNTFSSPSVLTIKNDNIKEFNKDLIWLMDVEYYKRMYDDYGLPLFIYEISVVNRTWGSSLSNTLTSETKLREVELMKNKYN